MVPRQLTTGPYMRTPSGTCGLHPGRVACRRSEEHRRQMADVARIAREHRQQMADVARAADIAKVRFTPPTW